MKLSNAAQRDSAARDRTFQILSGIAILLVVLGHLDLPVLTVGGLFPYYSFHVMVFLFLSGNFYKEENEEHILRYILRKAEHLLLPYYVWNLVYGILVSILHRIGFGFGEGFGFYSFLAEPFIDGHQFMLNFPAWFVPALFLIQVINVTGRKLLSLLHWKQEWLIFCMTLLAGVWVVCLSKGGHVWGFYRFPGRILFMLPCFEMGCFYRKYLRERDTVAAPIYFAVILLIQLLLKFTCGGLAYSAVWCTSFANHPLIPYVSTVTGIAFWLRIARLLASCTGDQAGLPSEDRTKRESVRLFFCKAVRRLGDWIAGLGDLSFSVMMHHMTGFFILNCFFFAGYRLAGLYRDFDLHAFRYQADYIYLIHGCQMTKWIYLCTGVSVALILHRIQERVIGGWHVFLHRKDL